MKRTEFTTTTTLPASIPRETVIDTLHNHQEMIKLNPLVVNYARCQPVPSAPDEERGADWTWYEITDRISFLPGGLLRGNISYKGSFQDIPRGLRSHVYAPTGLEIRATWSVGGSQRGEARDKVNTEADGDLGLFLREEVDLWCPFWSAGFAKKTMRRSHGVLVDRLVDKAGLGQTIRDHELSAQTTMSPSLLPPEIRINDIPASKMAEPGAAPSREKRAIADLE